MPRPIGGDNEAAEFDDVLQVRARNHFGHQRQTPYGVNCITRREASSPSSVACSMAVSTRWPFATSSFNSFAPRRRGTAKITTLIIDVRFAPVRSANGFFGKREDQLRDAQVHDFTGVVALNGVEAGGFRAALNQSFGGEPNILVTSTPTSAAISVVNSRGTDAEKLILPSCEALCRRATALRIEAKPAA